MKSVDRIVTGTVRYPDSGIWESFAYGIRNSSQGIRNPADRNPRSTDKEYEVQYLNPESRIQDCLGFPYTWQVSYGISERKGLGRVWRGQGEKFLPILQTFLDCQLLRQTRVYPVCW